MTWIEQEHGWVAASEEVVNASGRAVCDKASSTPGIGGLGVLVTRPAWHQAIVDIDGESLKGR